MGESLGGLSGLRNAQMAAFMGSHGGGPATTRVPVAGSAQRTVAAPPNVVESGPVNAAGGYAGNPFSGLTPEQRSAMVQRLLMSTMGAPNAARADVGALGDLARAMMEARRG